jgi:molybdenum cofactor cytidylyltransferase
MPADSSRMAGIVLAAGESRRMGRPKQLLSAGRGTVLAKVLKAALNSSLDRVVLVLGHESRLVGESLGPAAQHPKLETVLNPRYREGMSTSLIEGLRRVEKTCDRVMVILGDMPHLWPGLIDRLRKEMEASDRPLGALATGGRRTHPVVIGREFYAAVHGLTGDRGARGLFRENAARVLLVDAGDAYNPSDIDTPLDYEKFRRAARDEGASGGPGA